ncbi:MAG TPA: toll/interleukin-1 receptor domain-containing protein [Candidatus Dormibacteraeota bacterium]|jgi:uncharacterized protein YjbI with pentapeptide repeats|nr:toll/interleukin-1 receptor domain-containing protein [Candidatus Dormibacteraeota bacterium]
MANKEHLAILKEGVKEWNEWRTGNPKVRPDLSGLDLPDSKLDGVDLRQANLEGAILRGVRLVGARLYDADLSRTNLRQAFLDRAQLGGANLSHAILFCASLIDADLTGTTLHYADLREAVLVDSNLTGADLLGANLSGSDMRRAVFEGANLGGANLRAANCSQADLTGTTLRSADLSRARLDHSSLRGADLHAANFSGAHVAGVRFKGSGMERTLLANVDLSSAKELDAVLHAGPSTIGLDTIYESRGAIPEVFLRGAGVPEPFIVQMKALVNAMEPIQFYSCFISHSSKDEEFTRKLHRDLQAEGVRCWFAPEDMKIGDPFRDRINEAVRLYDKLLLVLSESSIESPWVEDEVEAALEKERLQKHTVLFPIRLDDAVMSCSKAWAARVRRILHMGDFRKWKDHDEYQKAFARLMRDLKAE